MAALHDRSRYLTVTARQLFNTFSSSEGNAIPVEICPLRRVLIKSSHPPKKKKKKKARGSLCCMSFSWLLSSSFSLARLPTSTVRVRLDSSSYERVSGEKLNLHSK